MPRWPGRLAVLRDLVAVLAELQVTVEIDLCVVRSHEYYTGVAFEIDVITADEAFVEVGGGGRYDKLVSHFAPGSPVSTVPATGFAFGLERLVHLLNRLDLLGDGCTAAIGPDLRVGSADLLLVPGATPDGYRTAARQAALHRSRGWAVDIYLGDPDGRQQYATARAIPEILPTLTAQGRT